MSWFSKGSSNSSNDAAPALPASLGSDALNMGPSPDQSAAVQMIRENFKAYTQQLNVVNQLCWEKCMSKKNQSELSIGELSCDDRCVLKFLATTTKVGEVFGSLMSAQAQQQQQQQQPPQ